MSALQAGFREALEQRSGLAAGGRVVVALSGGLDSVVLLHLLRFAAPAGRLDLVAAHFDHAMRPSSAEDRRWVVGLCAAWGVPLLADRAEEPPASEDAARELRYAFLERVRREVDGQLVVTAHHADDQAETVLFRALRGSGAAGLAGIPERRAPSLWRPLLGFWRDELEAYAERARLAWREDPTNAAPRYARNVLRARILPDIERLVAPGARRALVRLADLAREDEAGWASVLPGLMEPLALVREAGGASLDRAAYLTLHPSVQARILRTLASETGLSLDETKTRAALAFAAEGASGRGLQLGAGWCLERHLDRLRLIRSRDSVPDVPVIIADVGPGSGDARLAGSSVPVTWGRAGAAEPTHAASGAVERFDPEALRFPLTVRAREPGDRIRLASGTKKVKKLFLEMRIPLVRRLHTPLLVDAEGEVLWIPAVARAVPPRGRATDGALRIGIG